MGKEVMGKKENEMAQEKERPAGSQSLFRGLMLIEILSNYPNGCPLAHLSELAGLNKSTVHRLLQGLQSCGYVTTENGALKIWKACAAQGSGQPGTVLRADRKKGLIVATGDGAVELCEIQAPGAKRMEAKAYLLGHVIPEGQKLSEAKL